MHDKSGWSCFCLPFNRCLCLFESGVFLLHRCQQCVVECSAYESSVGACFVPVCPAIDGLCPRALHSWDFLSAWSCFCLPCDQVPVCMVVFLLTMQSGSVLLPFGCFLSSGELERVLSFVKMFTAACSDVCAALMLFMCSPLLLSALTELF